MRWSGLLKLLACGALAANLTGCPTDGPGDAPQSRAEASRFLTQATFGADDASIDHLMTVGYEAWIDEQFALKPAFSYQSFFQNRDTQLKAANASAKAGPDQTLEAFFTLALTDQAQLRARLAFALSEIFVVSYTDDTIAQAAPVMVASYMDTLNSALDGSYRDLLEAVTKSPAMGEYLTYRGNTREVPALGHFPDENYAREVMQLFSIGLYQLNTDGSLKLDGNGQPIETYTSDDIRGLAMVFTGWGNYRGANFASASDIDCFSWNANCRDPQGFINPMVAYPTYHSVSQKTFLGTTLAAQTTPDPQSDLSQALDTLANHPNTAPFIAKQLIQRLVTSNPTTDYVGRVAARFTSSGGNIKETVKAILLDDEARGGISLVAPTHGKLREPVLRLTALLRAFKFAAPTLSTSGSSPTGQSYVAIGNTSDPVTSWGQAPLYSPSVFNFFRPGYTPPLSTAATQGMVVPEMQIVNDSSISGYVNAVIDLLSNGIGNVTLQFSEQRAMAYDPNTLTQHIADRLLGGTITDALRNTVVTALNSISVPALNSQQSNGDAINAALDKRVYSAIAIVAVSPEFLITK